MRSLKDYAHIYPKARYKRAWRDAGYREFIAEDFHFAYEIFIIEETGEEVAYIVDACHSYLYYNEASVGGVFFSYLFCIIPEIVYLCTRRIEDRAPAFWADTHFLLRARCFARCHLKNKIQNAMAKIKVQDTEITISMVNGEDYICITDMLKAKDGDFFVTDWLRNRNTMEFLGVWERVYNPNFNYGEFAIIRNQSGLNSFKISVKEFVARTNAISLQAKAGRYGGTYAHKDIAFEFAMWISPEFKVYVVRESRNSSVGQPSVSSQR